MLARRSMTMLASLALCSVPAGAQWSTSTSTNDALVIDYGFFARALVESDGSSIFCHGPDNSVYLTRLDERGFRLWPQPVVAHYNDSTDNGGGGLIVSDGERGAIILWEDHRGAYRDPSSGEYMNEALYLQCVDSSGVVRWAPGGVPVAPAYTGRKAAIAATDGNGGVVVAWTESSFFFPGATNREVLKAARFDGQGARRWERAIDSTDRIGFRQILSHVRAGSFAYVHYVSYDSVVTGTGLSALLDTNGVMNPPYPVVGYVDRKVWHDSTLFTLSGSPTRISKTSPEGNILWDTTIPLPGGCAGFVFPSGTMVPDSRGGVFCMYLCNESLWHVDSSGIASEVVFTGLNDLRGHAFPSDDGGLVLANDSGLAQRFDGTGARKWGVAPVVYQSDPENTNFRRYAGDNKGGILVSFWTPSRGLCAQHTGRNGAPGIVPVEEDGVFLDHFAVFQNYPNPDAPPRN
jgi:hypothetical protein